MRRAPDPRPTEPTAPTAGAEPLRGEAAQRSEFLEALDQAERAGVLIQPSADEARNGWTAETLTAYVTEQRAAAETKVDPRSAFNRQPRRPAAANSKYRPHRWRG